MVAYRWDHGVARMDIQGFDIDDLGCERGGLVYVRYPTDGVSLATQLTMT